MRFTHVFTWIWDLHCHRSDDGTQTVTHRELDIEIDKASDWSLLRLNYDGHQLTSVHLGRLQIGWGQFTSRYSAECVNVPPQAGMTFFDKPPTEQESA